MKLEKRPWGSFIVLDEQDGFKIKRIEVEPLQSLSLQSHEHREEHWVVVAGSAKVENNEKVLNLKTGESTFIPIGNKHRLSNTSQDELLVVVEVQTGKYLGEDDIKRYKDRYGRSVLEI